MSAFKTQCPTCQTKIKLQDRKLVGKTAKCPKCKGAFTIRPIAAKSSSSRKESATATKTKAARKKKKRRSAPPPPSDDGVGFLDDLSPDEFEADSDSELDEFDEFLEEEEEAPATRARRRERSSSLPGKPGKSSRKKSGKKSTDTKRSSKNLVIGFMVLGVFAIAVAGSGIYLVMSGGGFSLAAPSRFAWLPDDIETIIELDPATIFESRAFRATREYRFGTEMHKDLKYWFKPLDEERLARVTIGMPGEQSANSRWVFVFYGKGPFKIDELKSAAPEFVEKSHGEATYYFKEAGQRAAYFPEPAVLVYGTEEQVTSAIDRKGVCAAEKTITLPEASSFVFSTPDLRGLIQSIKWPRPRLMDVPGLPGFDSFQRVTGAVDINYDYKCDLTFVCDSEGTASSLVEKINEGLKTKLDEMEFDRGEKLKLDQVFKMDIGGIRRLFTQQQNMLKSVSASASGEQLKMQLTASNFFMEFMFLGLDGHDPADFGIGVTPDE